MKAGTLESWKIKCKAIMIDFDGTIYDFPSGRYDFRKVGKLQKGAKEAITRLWRAGFYIIVGTARPVTYMDVVVRRLNKDNIPYQEVRCGVKPIVQFYIDDRAVEHKDWKSTMSRIRETFSDV